MNFSQNCKYVFVTTLISQYLQARWSRERAFGEKLSARNERLATFSLMRNPLSFVCFSPSSEQLSWQSFWPKVLMLLKRSPRPICPQTHIPSRCRFPTLPFLPRSPDMHHIETQIQDSINVYLFHWTSFNRSDWGRFSSTEVNCPFRMTSFLHLHQKYMQLMTKRTKINNSTTRPKKTHWSKSWGRHLLLIPVVVLPFELRLTPIAAPKVVVERLRGLLHLKRMQCNAANGLTSILGRLDELQNYLHTKRSKSENTGILFHSACPVFPPE